jgi:hypothetical protein
VATHKGASLNKDHKKIEKAEGKKSEEEAKREMNLIIEKQNS